MVIPLGMHASHFGVLVPVPAPLLPIQPLDAASWEPTEDGSIRGLLPPAWQAWTDSQAPGFSPAQP